MVTDPPCGLHEYSPTQQKKLRERRGGVWRIPPSFDGHRRSPLPRFTTLTTEQLAELERFFHEWGRKLRLRLVPGAHVLVASSPLLSFIVAGALARAGLERRGEIIRLTTTMRGGDRPKAAHTEFPEVSAWKRQAVEGLDEVFSGPRSKGRSEHEETTRALHAKIGELTVEHDFFGTYIPDLTAVELALSCRITLR